MLLQHIGRVLIYCPNFVLHLIVIHLVLGTFYILNTQQHAFCEEEKFNRKLKVCEGIMKFAHLHNMDLVLQLAVFCLFDEEIKWYINIFKIIYDNTNIFQGSLVADLSRNGKKK